MGLNARGGAYNRNAAMDAPALPERPRVLVIDDSLTMRHMLGAILKPACDVTLAASGAEGLALAVSASPALILLDVVMPDLDGHEVLRRLKADERTAAIPVVFVTGLEGLPPGTSGGADGVAGCVAKPIRPDAVRAEVARHLRPGLFA